MKQTKTSVVGAERFIAGPCKETGGLYPKNPQLLEGFQQITFKGEMRAGHLVFCAGGWRNLYGFLTLNVKTGDSFECSLCLERLTEP